jgi:hypothetical protein
MELIAKSVLYAIPAPVTLQTQPMIMGVKPQEWYRRYPARGDD